MKKILFLTDFSKVADNAFIYALSLADTINAEIHILHVVHIIVAKDAEEEFRIHPLARMLQEQQQTDEMIEYRSEVQRLENIAKISNKIEVPVEFHFEKGEFIETVQNYIDTNDIDMVVMGTSGSNTIDKKIFGSYTANLISQVEIPVLAIPEKAKFVSISNFTAAVMLDKSEYSIIRELKENSQRYGFNFNCVHIAGSSNEAAETYKKLQNWLANTEYVDTYMIINDDIEEGIMDFAQRNKTDVLCVIHRALPFLQRLFKINYSRHLLRYSSTALLVYNNNFDHSLK